MPPRSRAPRRRRWLRLDYSNDPRNGEFAGVQPACRVHPSILRRADAWLGNVTPSLRLASQALDKPYCRAACEPCRDPIQGPRWGFASVNRGAP